MGLSFFGVKRDGVTYMGHTGSQAGFHAFMYFDPTKHTAILVAFNTTKQRSTPGARDAQKAMMDAAFGLLR
jgi:hypothetical protein